MLTQLAISDIIGQQRDFFRTGKTKEVAFRTAGLKKLEQAIDDHTAAITQALKADLNKPEFETYLTEIALCKSEISYALKNIKTWTKPQKAKIGLEQQPGRGRIYAEPLGVVLIIGAWNYTFQLTITPLI